MRSVLLAAAGSLAVVCLGAAPAQAQSTFVRGFFAPPGASTSSGGGAITRNAFRNDRRGHHDSWGDGHGDRDRHGHSCFGRRNCDFASDRDRRNRGNTDVIMDWYGGEWALYNNRSFDSDSYNDWWHDRTDRSMPRWVTHNQDCSRMWYAGDTLRC